MMAANPNRVSVSPAPAPVPQPDVAGLLGSLRARWVGLGTARALLTICLLHTLAVVACLSLLSLVPPSPLAPSGPPSVLVFGGPSLALIAAIPARSSPSTHELASARALALRLAAGGGCLHAPCLGWSPALPALELRALALSNGSFSNPSIAPSALPLPEHAGWAVSFAPRSFPPSPLPPGVTPISPELHWLHPEDPLTLGRLLAWALYALLAVLVTVGPSGLAYAAISSLTAPLHASLLFMSSLERACLPSAPPPTPQQSRLTVPGSGPPSEAKPPSSPEVTVRESKRVLRRLSALVSQHQQAGLAAALQPSSSPDPAPRSLAPAQSRAPVESRPSLRKRSVVASALAPRDQAGPAPQAPAPQPPAPAPGPLPALAGIRALVSSALAWLERACGAEWQLAEMASLEAACGRLLHAVHASQRHSFLAHDAKRQFSRYLFHELRVPFNTVVMGIQQLHLAAESADRTPVADMAELLDLLDSQCGAIINILNDTMSLQKLEEGSFSVRHAPFSLHNLVLHTVQAFYPAIEERNLRLTLRLQSLEDLHSTDPRELFIDNVFTHDPSSPLLAPLPLASPALLRRGSSGVPLARPPDGSPLPASPGLPFAPSQHASPRVGLPCAAPTPLFLRRTLSEARVVRSTSADKLARRQQLSETIRVLGDQNRIRQVIANLISNAIKFTPQNGSISITLSAEPAPEESPAVSRASSTSSAHSYSSSPQPPEGPGPRGPRARVRLSVKDTGPGIPPDRLSNLFKPFSQFRAGEAQQAKGTGLGLAISRRLVELHGGRMGCHSEIGRGAEVFFVVDLDTVAGAPDEQPTVIDMATALKGPLVSSDFKRTRLLSQSPVIRDAKALSDQTKEPSRRGPRAPARRTPSSRHTERAPSLSLSGDSSPRSPLTLSAAGAVSIPAMPLSEPAVEAATGAHVLGLSAARSSQVWTAAPSAFSFAGAGSFASDTPAPSLRALPEPAPVRSPHRPQPADPAESGPHSAAMARLKDIPSPTDLAHRDGIRLRRPLTAGGQASAAFQALSSLERAQPEERPPERAAPLNRVFSAPEPAPSPRPDPIGHARAYSLGVESELKEPSEYVPPLPLASVAPSSSSDPSPSLSASSLSASSALSPSSSLSSLSSPAAPPRMAPSLAAAAAAAAPLHRVPPPARARVLVADDSAPTRKLVSMILQRLGFDVLTVENGAEAVGTFREWIDHRASCPHAVRPADAADVPAHECPGLPCELVLMDGCMPVLGGLEATQQLRQAALPLPILGLTGNALPEDQAAFLAAGADAVLVKPVDRAVLAAALQKHLSRPAWVRPRLRPI